MTENKKPFVCSFCNHGFSKESTIITHICEPKRRSLAQHEKHVVLAYKAFNRFQQLNALKVKSYDEFSKSPYYLGFVKFGSFINNIKPLYPNTFVDYVIKSGTKLDHWCKQGLYDKYVVELIRTENVETALSRSIEHMVSWASENNTEWNQYFNKVSLSRATYDIQDGKISPWLILNAPTGKTLLSKFNDEQLLMINSVIDPKYWISKFKKSSNDVIFVKHIVEESGL